MASEEPPPPLAGTLLKRSPAPLRFGAYDKRSVLLKGGRLYWSKGISCSEKSALGYVDFTSLECEVTAEAASGSRFTVSPLGGKWLAGAGQFTGSSAGRAFAFEAAPWSCEHSREDWMAALRAHVAYAQAVGRPAAAERSEELEQAPEWLDPITPRAASETATGSFGDVQDADIIAGGRADAAQAQASRLPARHSCEATDEEISAAAREEGAADEIGRDPPVSSVAPAPEEGPPQLVEGAPEEVRGADKPATQPTGPSPRSSQQHRRSLSDFFDDDGEQAKQEPQGTPKSATQSAGASPAGKPATPRLRKSLSEYFDDDSD